MSVVRTAIQAKLLSDSTLLALLATPTSVYHRQMPQTARVPAVIFDKRSSQRRFTMATSSKFYIDMWAIRGVAFGRTADRAEDIAARLEVLFQDAVLTVSGRSCLDVRLESDIDFPEQVGKEIIQHSGAVWRVTTCT